METTGLVVLATSRTWLTCHGSQSEGLVHWFFQVCGNSFTTVMPRLWAVIEMQCNESTIYIYPQFKRQYFLQTIENSNLLTYFTTDFTNLSLKLKLVIDSDAKELPRGEVKLIFSRVAARCKVAVQPVQRESQKVVGCTSWSLKKSEWKGFLS